MNEEVQNIQMTLEQAENKVAFMQDVVELLKDPLFEKVITDNYLGDDTTRLMLQLKPGEENKRLLSMLEAKSVFSRFIATALSEGEIASQSIQEHKELLSEIDKD